MSATCELRALMLRTSNCFMTPKLHVLAIRDRTSLLAHHAHSDELRSRAYYFCVLAHETARSPDDVIMETKLRLTLKALIHGQVS